MTALIHVAMERDAILPFARKSAAEVVIS